MRGRIQAGPDRPTGFGSVRAPTTVVRGDHRVLLAYQRNAGNRAVQRLLANTAGAGSVAQRQPAAPAGPNPRTIRFSLSVETEGIGHAWIEVARPDGSRDSWGFWPAGASTSASSSGSGAGVYGSSAIEHALMTGGSVAGMVLHPDTRHRAQVQHTMLVTERELARGIAYARLHATERYNLYSFNCTTFARGMYHAVTGHTAPLAGILIDDPADLAQSIRQERESPSEFPPALR